MASEKLVFRNAEERELWHWSYMCHATCWANRVEGVYGTEEQVADAAVLAYRERCGDPLIQPTRDEGPWAVWMPRDGWWWSGGDEADNNTPGVYNTVRAYYSKKEAAAENRHDWIVAPFPRTRAEFERGPIGGGG